MDILQALETRFDETIKSINNVVVETRELYEQERAINQATLEKFFTPQDGDEIRFSHFNVEVFTKESLRSMFTSYPFIIINVQDSYDGMGEKTWTNLYVDTDGYESVGVDESVAERFEKQAYYTRIAIDFEDDIVAEFNQTRDKTKESSKVINLPVSKLSREAENLREEIDTLRKLQQ